MTLPEVVLWAHLRGSKQGIRFRRQHPLGPYVVDFCAPAVRLAVEVDGEVHGRGDRPARDAARDRFLADNGYRLLRLPATLILADLDAALAAIRARAATPLHRPAAGPPPRPGEDLRSLA